MTEMDELTVSDEQLASILSQEPVQWWVAPIIRELQQFRAMSPASLSPAGVTEEQVEAAAKRIFEHWQFTKPIPAIPSDGVPAWVEGGNSLMQDKARAFARAALEAAAKAQPRDYTDFDDWFHEQEGTSLRSERFSGDVEWLKAAFDAGRSAEPSISTGQGEAVAWSEEDKLAFVALGHHILAQSSGGETGFSSDHARLVLAALNKLQSRLSLPAGHVAVPVEVLEHCLEAFRSLPEDALGYGDGGPDSEVRWPFRDELIERVRAALPHNQGEGK